MKFRNILLTTFAASAFVIGTTSCSCLLYTSSYGTAGNEAIGVYQSRVKMDSGMLALGGASKAGLWPNDLMGNADLTWETTKSFNVGLDFGLWNNRLTRCV